MNTESSKNLTVDSDHEDQSTGDNQVWLSVSEAAKIGGVQTKTIRRAIKKDLKYLVKGNRYSINFKSLIDYLHKNTKLKNKLNEHGIGQWIEIWK
ncbi:MAG: helix-turn-helix domain-containing protein [Candidatus Falkowbacteria bacterium]